jgi:hypothetical protein
VRVANGSVAISWVLLIFYGIDTLVAIGLGSWLNVFLHMWVLIILIGAIRQARALREKLKHL